LSVEQPFQSPSVILILDTLPKRRLSADTESGLADGGWHARSAAARTVPSCAAKPGTALRPSTRSVRETTVSTWPPGKGPRANLLIGFTALCTATLSGRRTSAQPRPPRLPPPTQPHPISSVSESIGWYRATREGPDLVYIISRSQSAEKGFCHGRNLSNILPPSSLRPLPLHAQQRIVL
jgi:hypothetical protein